MKNNLIIFIILLGATSYSQDVAVSEYYNISGSPVSEWVELIVLEDNVNLSGFILRDNGGTGGSLSGWSGGIVFRNSPLWRNLRQGTIIVINNRGGAAQDDNKSDGYIEIGAQNTTYFNQVVYIGSNWATTALNFGQDSEIVELSRPGGNTTEHALAHVPNQPNGDLLNIPDDRHLAANSTLSARWSVRVIGGNRNGYIGGFDQNNNKVRAGLIQNVGEAKGLPNSTSNSNYWRRLREPSWDNPNLNVNVGANIRLNWNAMEDDHDDSQGYLIVAYPKTGGFNNNDLPDDGEIYQVGDNISNNSVVLGRTNSNTRTLTFSANELDCTRDYTIRVYAYRYSRDDQNRDSDESNARGRSYNQDDFAEETISFETPDKPVISNENGTIYLCENGTTTLSIEDDGSDYQWFFNDGIVAGETSPQIEIDRAGRYKVTASSGSGCEIESDEFNVVLESNPFARITYEDRILPDTTFVICSGESLTLEGRGGEQVFWNKDNQRNGVTDFEVNLTDEGTYFIEAINKGVCSDVSNTITIKVIDVNIEFSETNLDFGNTEFVTTRTIRFTNNSDIDVLITEDDIEISPFFSLQDVDYPINIPANEFVEITFRFEPSDPGEYSGTFTLTNKCNFSKDISLQGVKPTRNVSVDKSVLDYQNTLSCNRNDIENQIVYISRVDSQNKYILSATIDIDDGIFNLENPEQEDFPLLIDSDDDYPFEVSFNPLNDGSYSNTLTLVVSDNGIDPSFETKILLIGTYRVPEFEISSIDGETIDSFNFGDLSDCDNDIDSSYIIKNTGTIPLDFFIIDDSRIAINNNPNFTIQGGEEQLIEFTYTPSGLTDNGFISISTPTCELEKNISFESTKSGFILEAEKDTFDLGDIYPCDIGSQISILQVPINVAGNSEDLLTLDQISSLLYFSQDDVGSGDTFQVGEIIDLEFELNDVSGEIEEEVTLSFLPCGEITFILKANIQDLDYFANPSNTALIDFGIIENGQRSSRSITIFNQMSDEMLIDNIQIPAPFEIDQSRTILPIIIPPNSELPIYLNFQPTQYGVVYEETLAFEITSPCSDTFSYNLLGETLEDDFIAKVYLDIPNDLIGDVSGDQVVALPLSISSDEISSRDLGLTKLDVKLTFNGSVLRVLRIIESTNDNPDLELSNDRISYGESAIQIDDLTASLEFGSIANFLCAPTIGTSNFTSIDIEILDAEFTGSAELITRNGYYESADFCERDYLLVDGVPFDINLQDGIFISNNYILDFYGPKDINSELIIIDMVGFSKVLFSEFTDGKNYKLPLDLDNGSYIIYYSNGIMHKTYRVLVID